MAMPVQQSFTRQFRKHEVFSFFLQKFAEKKRLPRKFLSTRIIRKEVEQLIPENSGTTWLKDYKRNTASDLGGESIERSRGGTQRRAAGRNGNGKLSDLSKQELDRRAKAAGIEGRSKMTKAELVKALRRAA